MKAFNYTFHVKDGLIETNKQKKKKKPTKICNSEKDIRFPFISGLL